MADYTKEIEFVNNHLGQIATVILQNADFDKATPIDIYNIKHTLFTRKFSPFTFNGIVIKAVDIIQVFIEFLIKYFLNTQ